MRLPDLSRPEASGRWLVPGAFATLAEPLIAPPPPSTSPQPAGLGDLGSRSASYRVGTVLGVVPFACYIGFPREGLARDACAGGARAVLPVLRPEAVQLPTAVRIGDAGPWPVRPGDPVRVDAAGIALGRWLITPVRSWRPPRVVPAPGLAAATAAAALSAAWPGTGEMLAGVDAAPADLRDPRVLRLEPELTPAARRGLYAAALRVVAGVERPAALLGLGPGLTPSGDDVVAGLLLGLRLLGREARMRGLAADASDSLAATTDLSGSLVMAAAQGYAAPPVVELLNALGVAAQVGLLRRNVDAVLAVGHSSGADVLTGIHAALAASAEAQVFQSNRAKESR